MQREQTDHQPQQPPVVRAAAETAILSTPEAALAAYLLVCGRPLTRIEDGGDQMISFVFDRVEPADVDAFRNGALVPAIDFAKASQKIHQIIKARKVERHALRPSAQTRERVPA